jgi:hypothetical protein
MLADWLVRLGPDLGEEGEGEGVLGAPNPNPKARVRADSDRDPALSAGRREVGGEKRDRSPRGSVEPRGVCIGAAAPCRKFGTSPAPSSSSDAYTALPSRSIQVPRASLGRFASGEIFGRGRRRDERIGGEGVSRA